MSIRLRTIAATLYLVFFVIVFVALRYSDDEGGIPLLILGLPWSIPILAGAYAMSSGVPELGHVLATDGGNFFMSVILCGGINAVIILGVSRVFRWLRGSAVRGFACLTTLGVLTIVAQLFMPFVQRDALERSRPQVVPKDAVHVSGVIGWWQLCDYDAVRNVNTCRIWNRRGLILEEGEFVPYDGGETPTAGQLQIEESNSTPQVIALKNGRFLMLKKDRAEMTRFLDWRTGKRATR